MYVLEHSKLTSYCLKSVCAFVRARVCACVRARVCVCVWGGSSLLDKNFEHWCSNDQMFKFFPVGISKYSNASISTWGGGGVWQNRLQVKNVFAYWLWNYKVVQIWPGRFVCKQVTVFPGHIWTALYYKCIGLILSVKLSYMYYTIRI
jgi:hypothetical protein